MIDKNKIRVKKNMIYELIVDKYGTLTKYSKKVKVSTQAISQMVEYKKIKNEIIGLKHKAKLQKAIIEEFCEGDYKKYMMYKNIEARKSEEEKWTEKIYREIKDKTRRDKYIEIIGCKKKKVKKKDIKDISKIIEKSEKEIIDKYFKEYELKEKYNKKNKRMTDREYTVKNDKTRYIRERGWNNKDLCIEIIKRSKKSRTMKEIDKEGGKFINFEKIGAIAYLLGDTRWNVLKVFDKEYYEDINKDKRDKKKDRDRKK